MQVKFVDTATPAVRCVRTVVKMNPLRRTMALFLPVGLTLVLFTGTGQGAPSDAAPPPPPCAPCEDFDRLNTLVRDGQIPKEQARRDVPGILGRIGEWYRQEGGKSVPRADWVFPLRGYTVTAVGEGPAHGYLPKGYDYYDGNRHGGHPSLDIFIRDRNQDDRDDRTGEPVAVLSVAGGVVVAGETEWHEKSRLRGGKYLWVYDPSTGRLFYYAHLREIAVKVGSRVAAGDTLGFVGRTGLNAHKSRSPTHLHLTCLSTATAALKPEYLYPDLVRARTVK